MNTVALGPWRDVERASAEARELMAELAAAIDGHDLERIVKASEAAYLAIGTLYALASAAKSH